MRIWKDLKPGGPKPERVREYEIVGYALSGKAELLVEGQKALLNAGDSWVVPAGSTHTYRILEPFTAVEATSPPASVHGRDQSPQPESQDTEAI